MARISATKDTQMGRIVQNCVNQLREMSTVDLEEPMESLLRKGLGGSDTGPARPGAGAGAGASGEDGMEDGGGGGGESLTLLGAIVAKLLLLIK